MLKEIRIAKEKDCPKMLELLEYICNLHSGIRPDLFKAGKSKYDSESLAKLLADENRITFVAADENDEVLGYISAFSSTTPLTPHAARTRSSISTTCALTKSAGTRASATHCSKRLLRRQKSSAATT